VYLDGVEGGIDGGQGGGGREPLPTPSPCNIAEWVVQAGLGATGKAAGELPRLGLRGERSPQKRFPIQGVHHVFVGLALGPLPLNCTAPRPQGVFNEAHGLGQGSSGWRWGCQGMGAWGEGRERVGPRPGSLGGGGGCGVMGA
jgi:hypothetical protein